jgi:hypothetical protein
MLSDHELQALRDIERRLRWTSPELDRLLNSMSPPPPESRRRKRAPVKGADGRGRPRRIDAARATDARLSRNQRAAAPALTANTAAAHPHRCDRVGPGSLGRCRCGRGSFRRCGNPPRHRHVRARTIGRQTDRRGVSIGSSCPPSPSSTDRNARAGSESS